MTSVSKNVYIYKLADIVNRYNNTYHGPIKMKLADVKSSINSKFEVGDHSRISKQKMHFCNRLESKLIWKPFYD